MSKKVDAMTVIAALTEHSGYKASFLGDASKFSGVHLFPGDYVNIPVTLEIRCMKEFREDDNR